MILYNVTINIDYNVHDEWLKWMREKHVPEVMNTGHFLENKICKMLSHKDEGGITYAIQYLCKDEETYERYQKEHAPALQKAHEDRFSGKFSAFRTLLKVVHTS